MSAVNPFTPPTAQVADVPAAHTVHGDLRFWSAKGRIGRVRYIGWVMVAMLIGMVAIGILSAVLLPIAGMASAAVMAIGYAAMMVFCTLALIQRSHDMGWSGWTVLIAIFVPFAGFIWLFKPGTAGPNEYGPPPPPNSTGVIVAAWMTLALPVLFGMIAAISIPAYQDYVKRAQAKQQQLQMQQQPSQQQ